MSRMQLSVNHYTRGQVCLVSIMTQVISQIKTFLLFESAAESTDGVGQRVSIVPRLVATSV